MNECPLVSVITPSFNQGPYLEMTIQSLLRQRYPRLEYIIVDGGSKDGTVDVIRRHAEDVSFWVSEPDRGQSHAFNKGLSRARGEIIGWLNSDDLYLGTSLMDAVEYFRMHPDVDIVFSDYAYIDEHGHFRSRRREIPFDYKTYLWTGDCYHANCAGFFRRSVFERLGPLDESLQYSMDYEFYLRAGKAGCRFGHVHTYWAAYRLHATSKSVTASARQRAENAEVRRRFRAPDVGPAAASLRSRAYKAVRIARKVLLGSYLPAPVSLQRLIAEAQAKP